jgi:recombination protein U
MANAGKNFERDIKASVPESCWIYRLRDNASSFSGGANTRFTSSNICDYIMLDDDTRTLFLLELKSTQGTSIPLTMIRQNQIEGLMEAGKHNLIAGFLFNFRNENNDTFFMFIDKFNNMIEDINKKSFNIKDLQNYGAIKINSTKKRTRYRYDLNKLIEEIHL